MKPSHFLILIIPLLTIGCSRQEIILTEEQIPDGIFYLKNDIKPYSGKCLVYYFGTELLKEEMTFKNGILNGTHISYYKNGNIKRTGGYCEGEMNGKWAGFDAEGKKLFEVEFKSDTLLGRFISWYSTGVIKDKGIYEANQRVGEWISYDEAGMILKRIVL